MRVVRLAAATHGAAIEGVRQLLIALSQLPEVSTERLHAETNPSHIVPRWVKTKCVTFKYGLGDQFIGVLKTLRMLGLAEGALVD